jgi:hypothetical protein
MTTATAEEYRAGPFGFSRAKHAFYEGTCYVRLARPDAALVVSQRALTLYRSTKAFMEPTIARIDIAMAHNQKGDLDGACHMSQQVAAIPGELRTGPITARVAVAELGVAPGLATLGAGERGRVVGRRAAVPLEAGRVIGPAVVDDGPALGAGQVAMSVALAAVRKPGPDDHLRSRPTRGTGQDHARDR